MAIGVSNWEKFKLLLWKNWVLQWNRKTQLVIELMLPAIFSLLLVLVRSLVAAEPHDQIIFTQQPLDNIDLLKQSITFSHTLNYPVYQLLYSPQNKVLDDIVRNAYKRIGLEGYHGIKDAKTLENELMATNYLCGVQFDDDLHNITDDTLPEKLSFALRFPSESRTASVNLGFTWLTQRLWPPIQLTGPRNFKNEDGGIPPGYLREGFLAVQQAISMAFLAKSKKVNVTRLPDIVMTRFPYPKFINDPLLEGLVPMMSLIMLVSFIYSCTCITKFITTEKEKQLKEVMKIMGLQNWIHWTAWFIKSLLMLAISCVLITLLIKIKWTDNVAVLTYSSWSALYFFLIIYIISSICFCFMIAVFFSKASTAAAVTGLVWFIAFVPFTFLNRTYYDMTLSQKLGWSLVSNTGMGFAIKIILGFEGTGEGLQWSNIFKPVNVDDSLTLGGIMIMMLLSAVIYMIVCLYIEQIFPGDFGVPKKWYFPFTRKFWCGENDYIGIEDSPKDEIMRHNPTAFEQEPKDKHIGLQVKNLKKNFNSDKWAVKDLSVNMYEDEITVLLGHNGAGKTTTISMLTGMFPPTAGTAIINGSDIRSNIEGARMSMGICPQHNVLFDDMSVANHIIFFSKLKGLKGDAIQQEVKKYLKMIDLENKANTPAGKLSGGMKRKLSVCCALCGGTKVVLLDEPSSGMDPAARRQLWDLLQAEKSGRTLLLTTHFMDEADILGDRIAIMCDGELKCHGTSFFLKKKFGSGYRLICVKRESCNIAEVTRLLNDYIPGIQPESDIGAELTYQLPDSYSPIFEEMFRSLEERSNELGLNGYGVGITSLEEVFMKVGAENANKTSRVPHSAIMNGTAGFDDDAESQQYGIFSENSRRSKGATLALNQWQAMFLKKILYTWRNKLLFLIQNIMPIFFVVVTVLVARRAVYIDLPPMTMNLTQYAHAVAVLEVTSNVTPNSLEANVSKQYEAIVESYGYNYIFESTGNGTFVDYILHFAKAMQVRINSRYLAAATISDGQFIAWLNNQPLHTAPMALNLLHNAMAKALISPNAAIEVTNYPLPYSTDARLNQLQLGNNLGAQMATNICFCMAFVSAFYILFPIQENQTRSKLLQFVGGVRVWTFWLTQFIWDIVTFMFSSLVLLITLACFQEDGYSTFDNLANYFGLLFIFGLAVLPLTYVLSKYFTEPATGFARVSLFNIFTGMALYIVVLAMSLPIFDTKDVADKLMWVFRVFPHFSLAMGMNNMYVNSATREVCSTPIINILPDGLRCQLIPQCCSKVPYFGWKRPGVLPETIYLLGAGVIFLCIIIGREYRVVNQLFAKMASVFKKPTSPPPNDNIDEDVIDEKKRILSMSQDEIAEQYLVLDRVTKYYKTFLAVNQISLCVKQTECFGLLGVNGAGKTTTFKMLTGDERISSGQAYVKGMSLLEDMNLIYREIGYCPQFDALIDDLTGRELLRIYCLLRGVPKDRIRHISEELAKSFGFIKHLDKPAKDYSGGNKRKLSTAIAVIGGPSVIYLDEPTTGMDPAARRQLWNMVCRIRDSGKSIVLTSHSMEECEALCTRLAIMVNGEFKCIGSTQHLKNKFSKGLILKIKVKRSTESLKFNGRLERSLEAIESNELNTQLESNTSALEESEYYTAEEDLEQARKRREEESIREVSETERKKENKKNEFKEKTKKFPRSVLKKFKDFTRSRSNMSLYDEVGKRNSMISLKLQEDIERVKEFVEGQYPQAVLQEDHQGMLTYYVPLMGIKWSEIFGFMERNRKNLYIEDYSISQTTLEEIFLEFAKLQREDPRALIKQRNLCKSLRSICTCCP